MTVQYQGVWTLQNAAQLQSTQRWVTDPLYKNTTLLLQADDAANGAQNNTFLDSSSNNFTITRNGNTTQGTFTPFSQSPGWWGNYFGGAGSYLSNTSTALIGSTVSTFTAEAWIYMTAAPTSDANNIGSVISLDGQANGTFNYMAFGPISNQKLFLRWFDGTGKTCNGSTVLALNTWYHIAVVVNSNAISMYVNGVPETLSGTTTLTNRNGTSNEFAIATNNYTSFSGYISNVRVTNTAVYTSAFTPSTIPLTSPSGTLLLTSQSNRFVDTNTQAAAKTLTPAGIATSVQAFSPFAPQYQYTPSVTGGSGYFDGNGDYLTGNGILVTTTTANTFSCEGWFYPTTFANLIWLVGDMDATGGTNNVAVDISTGGAVELYWWDGAAKRCTSTSVMRLKQWNYFAIVVNAGAISIYVNSTTAGQSGTTTLTNRSAASQNFSVGAFLNSTTPNGYIGSLRWSTSARTISSIPTAPYTSDANTRLLLNFTNAGIYDGTLKNNLETVGNAQISTSVVKYGSGSMYFDGTGDYLVFPANPLYAFGTGDFTVEAWVYPTSNAAVLNICGTRTSAGTVNGWNWGILTNGSSQMYSNSAIANTGASTVPLNTWTHLAFVRTGGTIYGYVNGVQRGSTANTENFTINTFWVGITGGTAEPFFGYIDDLRITRGIARYTANFTPPTVALPRQ